MEQNFENNKYSILLVEDQPLAAEITKVILSSLNCWVDIAENGEMAIIKTQNNVYDLIFMDIGLPDMTGYEVSKRIRSNKQSSSSQIPIIALTARIDNNDKNQCIDAGINAILIKPLFKEKALDMLNTFILDKKEDILLDKLSHNEDWLTISGKVVDLDLGAQLIGGTVELAKTMIHMMLESFPAELEQLNNAYQTNNWKKIRDLVHKLRGGVCYCGLPRLHQACIFLEDYLMTDNCELSDALYHQLIREIESVKVVCAKDLLQ